MDRLSSTESNVSATYGRRLNKSYYEPFQGFAYCILVVNIVDMQKNKNKMKIKRTEAGKLTLALTDNCDLSKLQHFITSTVAFELIFPHTQSSGNFCDGLSSSATAVHQKSQKTSNSEQRDTKNKKLWWCFYSGGCFMCSVLERTKKLNHEEK